MAMLDPDEPMVSVIKDYDFKKNGFNIENGKPYVYVAYLENDNSKKALIKKVYIDEIVFYQSMTSRNTDYLLSVSVLKNDKMKKYDGNYYSSDFYMSFSADDKVYLSDTGHTMTEALQKLSKRSFKTQYSQLF